LFTLTPATIPTDLVEALKSLTLTGVDLTAVTANLNLPATAGAANIPVVWTSSLPLVITNDGSVTRPAQYDASVKMTATMTQVVNGITFTWTKDFSLIVKANNPAADQLAEWDFAGSTISESSNGVVTVKDEKSQFVGTVMNNARIRTIGKTTQYNVLDLGNGTGYFDMGTEIGKAIYSLRDYTMMGYYRINATNTTLSNDGNFYWTFSNTTDAKTDQNGYIFGSLFTQKQACSTNYWSTGDQEVGLGKIASKDAWHHMAFVQKGDIGTLYVDGVSVAVDSAMTNLPYIALPQAGRTGTLYNWLGRSCYTTDSYLQKTLLYDFQLLGVAMSQDDIKSGIGDPAIPLTSMLDNLTSAYAEDSDYVLPELTNEQENLKLGGLNAVTSNIVLPLKGTSDQTINITWTSTNTNLIDSVGNVTRPNYYNYNDTLTASLTKDGQKVTKSFPATVIAKDGTPYASNY